MAEIRIPVYLLSRALAHKRVKHLRLLATIKLIHNSRVGIDNIIEEMDLHPKTGKRLINQIVADGWAGTDGTYIFPRAWHRLKYSKRGGLYLTDTSILADFKKFEALCFAMALRRLYRKKDRAKDGSAMPNLSLRYVSQVMGLKERRCISLRSQAQRYGFIAIKRTRSVIGSRSHAPTLRKNIHGPPIFTAGKHTITPGISEITFNL